MRSLDTLSVDVDRRKRRRRLGPQRWRVGAFERLLMALGTLLLLILFTTAAVDEEAMELFAGLFVVSLPIAVTTIGAVLVFRAVAGTRRAAPLVSGEEDGDADDDDDQARAGAAVRRAASRLTPEQRLRRRYIAGEFGRAEFERGMVDVIKERFASGRLSLTAYERELDRLLERSRAAAALDDPASAGPTRREADLPGGRTARP